MSATAPQYIPKTKQAYYDELVRLAREGIMPSFDPENGGCAYRQNHLADCPRRCAAYVTQWREDKGVEDAQIIAKVLRVPQLWLALDKKGQISATIKQEEGSLLQQKCIVSILEENAKLSKQVGLANILVEAFEDYHEARNRFTPGPTRLDSGRQPAGQS